ncbi:MAG: DUF2200 family protein [Ilumatobacteraceae bacterium]
MPSSSAPRSRPACSAAPRRDQPRSPGRAAAPPRRRAGAAPAGPGALRPEAATTFEDFFAAARFNPNASLITGSVCGVRVQDVEDPLMQKIRYVDKLVDELAKGRSMHKVLRGEPSSATATSA